MSTRLNKEQRLLIRAFTKAVKILEGHPYIGLIDDKTNSICPYTKIFAEAIHVAATPALAITRIKQCGDLTFDRYGAGISFHELALALEGKNKLFQPVDAAQVLICALDHKLKSAQSFKPN